MHRSASFGVEAVCRREEKAGISADGQRSSRERQYPIGVELGGMFTPAVGKRDIAQSGMAHLAPFSLLPAEDG